MQAELFHIKKYGLLNILQGSINDETVDFCEQILP